MKYIKDLHEGERICEVYLCKSKISAVTKNGKPYDSITLMDKTGSLDGKIWEPHSMGIDDFEVLDYIEVTGEVSVFKEALQLSVKRVRKISEEEVDKENYFPVSPYNIEAMYEKLLSYIDTIENPYLSKLLNLFFREDEAFVKKFKKSSAAKSVHHGFIGGLLQHTLSVVELCNYYCKAYEKLNRDLLLTAAMCHDIGKIKELSLFPANDYTDDGQFLGHIVMGSEMIGEKIKLIENFPVILEGELKHCILAHHGEFEFGSPKKPAIMEAVALNFADNTDAKMETFTELLDATNDNGWLGFNRLFESNVKATLME